VVIRFKVFGWATVYLSRNSLFALFYSVCGPWFDGFGLCANTVSGDSNGPGVGSNLEVDPRFSVGGEDFPGV
jgi:hypothetical protein